MTLIGDEVILTTKGDLGGIVIFYVIGWNIEFIDSPHSRREELLAFSPDSPVEIAGAEAQPRDPNLHSLPLTFLSTDTPSAP
jgi:hypothetical protein